jgi:predicted secreted Zn-dependent protease
MDVLTSWKGTAMQDANLTWRKSTRSGAAGHCVEVANIPSAVLVRDSKDAGGPVLTFAATEWTGFVAGIRAGEFDRPGI